MWHAFVTRDSAFRDHICCIFFRGSKKQVIRTNTQLIVATMAYVHPIRDYAMIQFPGHAMRLCSLASMYYEAIARRFADRSYPFPTSITFANPAPQPIGNRHTRSLNRACMRAEFNARIFLRFGKRLAALRALLHGIMGMHNEPPFVVSRRRVLPAPRRLSDTLIIPQKCQK